ncbi:Helo-like-N domain-containing protein [Fusarium keratoplasticum]|uniref:Helo-like-N domain-containing protein n=1 Tax=Fusarium keratoplasticum TaxID=1328300 RepID=A0ACC0R6W1_9HYPO|nr:Helo-like-N domain-containing protein [Fusarium keratoplasticum]KAI8675302.1 Helo-like-N domain-containing protein [Fusarium keratoplasticum]
MADPLSVVSGLLAIVTATIQSSKVLYQTVQSLRDHPRSVRQLRDELDALGGVLQSLEASAGHEPSILVPLKLPLEQCTKASADFQTLIVRYTRHSEGQGNISVRDWAKLRYMDNDINGFTAMLAGYKSTIAIALADANLRSSTVTLQVLNEYKDMIRDTKQDLENHLEEITPKSQSLTRHGDIPSGAEPADIERFRNERETTEQCLEICSQVLSHINGLRLLPVAKGEAPCGATPVGLSTQDLE